MIEALNKHVSQDLVVPLSCCTLINLCQNHYAVDFLILHNPGGAAAKKLYFVQVSLQRYQDCEIDKKFSSVTNPSPMLKNQSPLQYYDTCLNVRDSCSVYIYASPNVPQDKNFSRRQIEQNSVFFVKL